MKASRLSYDRQLNMWMKMDLCMLLKIVKMGPYVLASQKEGEHVKQFPDGGLKNR